MHVARSFKCLLKYQSTRPQIGVQKTAQELSLIQLRASTFICCLVNNPQKNLQECDKPVAWFD